METTTQKQTAMQTAFRYGLIGGVIGILYSVLMWALNMELSGLVSTLIQIAIFVLILYLAIQYHRDKVQGGFIKFGRGFRIGFLTSLIMGLIGMIYMFLFVFVIEPGFVDEMIDKARDQMKEKGQSDEEIATGIKYTKYFVNNYIMPIWVLIGNLFWGVLVSLVVSGVTQRRDPREGIPTLDSNSATN